MRALAEAGTGVRDGTHSGRWADLRLRVASAAVLLPVAVLCVWSGGPAWTALVTVAALALGIEWVGLCGASAIAWPGVLVPVSALAAALVAGMGHPAAALAVVALAALAGIAGGRWIVTGTLYVGIPVVALSALRAGMAGQAQVLFLLVVVWASDIGAYAVGRMVGGPKLAPSISPGKTRSGALGGLAVAVLLGAATALAMAPRGVPVPVLVVATAAAVLSVASQAGDLFESWVKRRFGAKDSGRLIPGHGGVLDRLDGLLTAAPVMAVFAWAGETGAWWR